MGEMTKNFPATQANAIATYDYIDIEDGSGVITFYGANSGVGNGITPSANVFTHVLTRDSSLLSNDIETSSVNVSASSGTFEKIQEVDFDISMNTQKILFGTCKFNLTSYINPEAGSGNVLQYLKISVIHYDGTTETVLGTVLTAITDSTPASQIKEFMSSISITTEKKFKKDEILRTTVECWGTRTGAGSAVSMTLAHDPAARNSTIFPAADAYTTAAKFLYPFRINN